MGTPVFYAQGLRMPYRMMNIIFFAAYVYIAFNMIYLLGWIWNKYGKDSHENMSHKDTNKINTGKKHISLDDIVNNFYDKIKASRKNAILALAISLCAFVIACIGCIEVGETEYKSGDAGFSNLPLSATAALSLLNGDAKIYDAELTARDEYLTSTSDDEQFITVPALSKRPAPIFHSDITDDAGDWHNAHLAMYYRKECVWTE